MSNENHHSILIRKIILAGVALPALLCINACSSMPDSWFGDDAPNAADIKPTDAPYPNLADVPSRPAQPDTKDLTDNRAALEADQVKGTEVAQQEREKTDATTTTTETTTTKAADVPEVPKAETKTESETVTKSETIKAGTTVEAPKIETKMVTESEAVKVNEPVKLDAPVVDSTTKTTTTLTKASTASPNLLVDNQALRAAAEAAAKSGGIATQTADAKDVTTVPAMTATTTQTTSMTTPAVAPAAVSDKPADITIGTSYALVKNTNGSYALKSQSKMSDRKTVLATAVYFPTDKNELTLAQYNNLKQLVAASKKSASKLKVVGYLPTPVPTNIAFDSEPAKRAMLVASYMIDLGADPTGLSVQLSPLSEAKDASAVAPVSQTLGQSRVDVLFDKTK